MLLWHCCSLSYYTCDCRMSFVEMVWANMVKDDRSPGAVEARLRASQRAVVDLGKVELQDVDLITLMNKAVELVAQTLEAPYCEVLELLPDGKNLFMRAG